MEIVFKIAFTVLGMVLFMVWMCDSNSSRAPRCGCGEYIYDCNCPPKADEHQKGT